MKICIVMSWGFEKLDGSNMRVYYLLKELITRRYDVTVIHSSKEDAEYTKREFGCKALYVDAEINRWHPIGKKILNYIRFVRKAKKLVRKIDVDVIFGISLINSLVAVSKREAGKKIMYVDFMSNYYRFGHPHGLLNFILFRTGRYLENVTLKKADGIVMITESMKKIVSPEFWPKISLIPDGVDLEKFKLGIDPLLIRKEFNLDNSPVIGYQGGIEPHDGLQFLANAAPRVLSERPDVKFLIAGRGSYLDEVKEIARSNGTYSNWIFTGWVDFSKIPFVMAAVTVNVIPIPDDPATRPLITFRLLESMAAGVNLVISDLPGMKEIVDETMVTFTRPEDPVRFSKDILGVLNQDGCVLEERKNRARSRAEALDWRKIGWMDANFIEGKHIERKNFYL